LVPPTHPDDTIAGRFHPAMGRPTKELYSMAGLLLIMEFKNWIKEEALDAYRFHLDIQYALNLEPVAHDISMRTLERYINYFEEDNLAKTIMSDITVELVDLLGIKIDQQRLDSTHIFSYMASFGRARMMGVTIKRFLTQVKRRNQEDYSALPEPLRQRYAPSVHQLFGNASKDSESRHVEATFYPPEFFGNYTPQKIFWNGINPTKCTASLASRRLFNFLILCF